MHEMIDNILVFVSQWTLLAKMHGVPKQLRQEIEKSLPLEVFST